MFSVIKNSLGYITKQSSPKPTFPMAVFLFFDFSGKNMKHTALALALLATILTGCGDDGANGRNGVDGQTVPTDKTARMDKMGQMAATANRH